MKFLRRGYLLEHLIGKHRYSRNEARVATLDAKRETRNGPHTYSYYEDISSDDDILDIIAEQRAANDVDTMEAISDFDVSMLDNVSGHVNDVSSRDQQSVPGSSSVDGRSSDDDVDVTSDSSSSSSDVTESSVDSRSSGDDVDVTSDSSGSSSDVTESTVDYRSVCDSASVQDSNDSRKSDVTSVSSGGVSDRQSVVDGVSVTEHDVSDVDGDVISVSSGDDTQIVHHTLRTEVEVWTRTGFKYSTYLENGQCLSTVKYQDDYYVYTMNK